MVRPIGKLRASGKLTIYGSRAISDNPSRKSVHPSFSTLPAIPRIPEMPARRSHAFVRGTRHAQLPRTRKTLHFVPK
jgi:hypothetical protein